MIMGLATDLFQIKRGVCQGVTLSTYVSIIALEVALKFEVALFHSVLLVFHFKCTCTDSQMTATQKSIRFIGHVFV